MKANYAFIFAAALMISCSSESIDLPSEGNESDFKTLTNNFSINSKNFTI